MAAFTPSILQVAEAMTIQLSWLVTGGDSVSWFLESLWRRSVGMCELQEGQVLTGMWCDQQISNMRNFVVFFKASVRTLSRASTSPDGYRQVSPLQHLGFVSYCLRPLPLPVFCISWEN